MHEGRIEEVDARDVELARFRREVHEGLSGGPGEKSISPKWLYDARGSEIFERICELDEYYPTRTERAILENEAPSIAATLGPRVRLVEPGSGDGTKADLLLESLESPTAFVPVEISEEPLVASARRLADRFPELVVQGVRADFTRPFDIPPAPPGTERTVVFFPGSTVGNFEPAFSRNLLRSFAKIAGPGGGLLVGVDLKKDVDVLTAAYDDSRGVTADFTKNLLRRMRNDLGAELDEDGFEHRARYEEDPSRMALELVAQGPQSIVLDGKTYAFDDGEALHVEYSHKPSREDFERQAATVGLRCDRFWTDPEGWFGVFWLVPSES